MTSYSSLAPPTTTPLHRQWLLSVTQIKSPVLSWLRRCHMPRPHSPLQSPPEPGSSSSARLQYGYLPLSKSNTSPYSKGQFLPSLRVNGISAVRSSLASLLLFSFTTPHSSTLWCLFDCSVSLKCSYCAAQTSPELNFPALVSKVAGTADTYG